MSAIAARRLHNQMLVKTRLRAPEDVVAWLGAVQGQEYGLAKWALALRLPPTTDADIEQAFHEGRILRTHVMRPTWHFVAPGDIVWLQGLTAPRVRTVNGTIYRRSGLDTPLLVHCAELIARALEGGHYRTRAELAAMLTQHGIDPANSVRLSYIMMYAELEAIICNGPRRGKQHTYALVSERAPAARRLPHAEALVELTRRFFASHGPATVRDFSWWSGLSMADARAGVAAQAPALASLELDGESYWYAGPDPRDETPPDALWLLPSFDEYTVPYKGSSLPAHPSHRALLTDGLFFSHIVHRGEIIGLWRHVTGRAAMRVELKPFRPLTDAEQEAITGEARRYSAFLGLPVTLA